MTQKYREFDQEEPRYPWMDGFNAVFDEFYHTGDALLTREELIAKLSIFNCEEYNGSYICGRNTQCALSLGYIAEDNGYQLGDHHDSAARFARGAQAAASVLVQQKQEVANV